MKRLVFHYTKNSVVGDRLNEFLRNAGFYTINFNDFEIIITASGRDEKTIYIFLDDGFVNNDNIRFIERSCNLKFVGMDDNVEGIFNFFDYFMEGEEINN